MQSNKLVSIIIPAYNAEKYINECVKSVLLQTYRNIEVIIVDDGSTDSTPLLIDTLCATDNRLVVIHKENGGVSAARNTGIDNSHGDYLVFVDADDYLALDYLEYMYFLVSRNDSEMALSTNWFELEGETQIKNDDIKILSNIEATALLIGPRVIVYSPNKIFKKSFIIENNLRFNTSLFYGEGMTFIVEAAQRCKSVTVGKRKVYYYRRNNNTSATTKFNLENFRNGEKALISVKDKMQIKAKKIDNMWLWHISMFYLGAIVKVKANGINSINIGDYNRWRKNLRTNFLKLVLVNYIPIYRRLMLLGGCISPWVMMKLDQRKRRYIYNHSVKSR